MSFIKKSSPGDIMKRTPYGKLEDLSLGSHPSNTYTPDTEPGTVPRLSIKGLSRADFRLAIHICASILSPKQS